MRFPKIIITSLKKIAKYARNSGFSAVIDLSVFVIVLFFTKPMFGTGKAIFISSIIARVFSSFVNFSLNKLLFKDSEINSSGCFTRYYVLWISLLTLSSSMTYFINDIFGIKEVLAKLISDMSLGVFSYHIQMRWVFTERSRPIKKGLFFRFTRMILRFFIKLDMVIDKEIFMTEHVLVGHHQNFYAPIASLVWMPDTVNVWVVSHLFTFKECFNMYYHFTFTKNMKLPKILAFIMSTFCALLIPPLLESARAIPVYRNTSNIMKTFNQSLNLLNKGNQILIFPDIDYNDTSTLIGEIYGGFTHLEKLYMRAHKKHLGFVPINIDQKSNQITNTNTIYFSDDNPYNIEKNIVINKIIDNINSKY